MKPTVKLSDDDFTLFGLPQRQALDRAELDARRRDLQARVHPDRFAAEGAAAQRVAMQWAVRVNEAYQRLKDPLKRGADGLFRAASGDPLPTDETAKLQTGVLEGSNVNAIETMVGMIQTARQFEAQMRLLQTAESNDRSAGQLLSLQG